MSYHKGQQIDCPHCGKETIVKLKSEMDGWTKVGEYFACAICDARLEDKEDPSAKADGPPKAERRAQGAAKLSDFLGTTKDEVKEVVEDDGERRFCRDCAHLLKHPFKVHCLLHHKDVNPMDDCPDFIRKTDDEEEAEEETS